MNETVVQPVLRCVVTLVAALVPVAAADADVVKLRDGRQFEGRILEYGAGGASIDTMVEGIRVQLGFKQHEVLSIERGPVPEGFFDRPEAAAAPAASAQNADSYLEVPIVGRFGAQVTATGVRRSLVHAAANGVGHIVFSIDSQGGDQIAAKEIYDVLAEFDGRLRYHAVVRDSIGVSMAVTVWCESVFVRPGANLGGVILAIDSVSSPEEEEVRRAEIAHQAEEVAVKRGWHEGFVRAMIDPAETLAAWKGDDGRVLSGVRLPAEVSRDRVLLEDRAGTVLTLTGSQAIALGLAKALDGPVSHLSSELGIAAWAKGAGFGQSAMAEAREAAQKRAASESKRAEQKIARLVKRRDSVKSYVERNLKLANGFDPDQAVYSRYKDHASSWDRYWGWDRPYEGTITGTRWRELTDATLTALRSAHKGLVEIDKLDAEGAALGLQPAYPPGEIEQILQDLDVKITLLSWNRNRATRSS